MLMCHHENKQTLLTVTGDPLKRGSFAMYISLRDPKKVAAEDGNQTALQGGVLGQI